MIDLTFYHYCAIIRNGLYLSRTDSISVTPVVACSKSEPRQPATAHADDSDTDSNSDSNTAFKRIFHIRRTHVSGYEPQQRAHDPRKRGHVKSHIMTLSIWNFIHPET